LFKVNKAACTLSENTMETIKFINVSNHPSAKWSQAQLAAARGDGQRHGDGMLNRQIVDIPFPNVPADASHQEVLVIAEALYEQIRKEHSSAYDRVLIQGEMGVVYLVVDALRKINWDVVHATTERKVTENADGSKTVTFEFVRFRSYFRQRLEEERLG
jgi:hypothetical protein